MINSRSSLYKFDIVKECKVTARRKKKLECTQKKNLLFYSTTNNENEIILTRPYFKQLYELSVEYYNGYV